MDYNETINSFQEAVSLGYSAKSVLEMIKDADGDKDAIEEIERGLGY